MFLICINSVFSKRGIEFVFLLTAVGALLQYYFFSFPIISFSLSAQVPVPVFLPTTLDNSEKILAAIGELRGKVPSSPLETELLNLSGVVPEHDGKAEASDVSSKFPDMNLCFGPGI